MDQQKSKGLDIFEHVEGKVLAQDDEAIVNDSGILDLQPCVSPGERPTSRMAMRKKKAPKAEDSVLGVLCSWIVEHQIGMCKGLGTDSEHVAHRTIGIAVNLLLLLALTHLCFPRARRHTRKFFDLSYYDPTSGRYTLGWDDIFMVFYWVVVFTGLRVAVMDYILMPLAETANITKKKERIRFAEQAWISIYDGAFWSLGMVWT